MEVTQTMVSCTGGDGAAMSMLCWTSPSATRAKNIPLSHPAAIPSVQRVNSSGQGLFLIFIAIWHFLEAEPSRVQR